MNSKSVFLVALLLSPSIAHASDVKISSVSVKSMTTAHLCRRLGGQGKDPQLVIKHDKTAGATIRIKMYDNVSNGRTINHHSTKVKSKASGVTTVSYNFLPPCNTTGNSVSSYKFKISSGKSKKTVKWGRYNSAKKKIIK